MRNGSGWLIWTGIERLVVIPRLYPLIHAYPPPPAQPPD